jgi:hypothetical protein
MIPEDFKDLSEILRRLQDEDKELRVFGARTHKHNLRPPLTENEMQAFEQKHQVILPDDFRWFYTHIGNGGAGPYYGLESLDKAASDCDLSKPFIWTEKVDAEDVSEVGEPYPGVLQIGHQGCTGYSYLVVNGPTYGIIWTGYEVDFWPENLTFAAWYRQWLDELRDYALPMLLNERVVKQVQVGMAKDEVINICGGEWHEEWSPLPDETFLCFDHLVTKFGINVDNQVRRIVEFSI